MAVVRTHAAAQRLGIAPSTLRTWERRYGFPVPRRTEGGHRQYDPGEIEALRDAFARTGSAAAAVALAREQTGTTGPAAPAAASVARLVDALEGFDEDAADAALAQALALRALERVLDETLLPAVAALPEGSPEQALGRRWAQGWLAAQRRLAPPATRADGVLLLDGAGGDAIAVAALELVLRRAGLRVLALPLDLAPDRLERAVGVLRPRVAVLSGGNAAADVVGRAVFACRRASGGTAQLWTLRAAAGASTVPALAHELLVARDELLALLDGRAAAPAPGRRLRVAG